MSSDQPFRKIFPTIASREKMYELINGDPNPPIGQSLSGAAYAGLWFENVAQVVMLRQLR